MARLQKLIAILKNSYYRKIFFRTFVAASTEHAHVLDELSKKSIRTILDVGANRGQFAIAARFHFPEAKIISFEPLEEAAEVFEKIFRNDLSVTLHHVAIGNTSEQTQIHISNADDSSSLLPIADLQSEIFPGTDEKETRMIQVKALHEVLATEEIQRPALLKMDVQGFEIEVFEGCGDLLLYFDFVYVECSFVELYEGQSLAPEVIALLAEADFNLVGVYNTSYDTNGLSVQADFLFEKYL